MNSQTALSEEKVCTVSDLPPAMCDHCRHPSRPAQQPPSRYGPWFPASYAGECNGCGDHIGRGGRIRADGTGGYLCEDCGQDDQEDNTEVNSQTALADLIAGLGQPTPPVKPVGPPCLDPWCVNGVNPCGHTPDAHMTHHGTAAIIAGEPTTTQASARIANRESQPTEPATAGVETGDLGRAPAVAPSAVAADIEHRIKDVIRRADAAYGRNAQVAPGPSEYGLKCDRRLAYMLAGIQPPEPQPPRDNWLAIIGTAGHRWLADAFEADNKRHEQPPWVVEQRVYPADGYPGTGDLYVWQTSTYIDGTVIDHKILGENNLEKIRRGTISKSYRVQIHAYGLGHVRAGRPVRHVALACYPRNDDLRGTWHKTPMHVHVEPYDQSIAEQAIDRINRISALTLQLDVYANPDRMAWIQADTSDCRFCPYRRPGGPADDTGCPSDIDKQLRGLIA